MPFFFLNDSQLVFTSPLIDILPPELSRWSHGLDVKKKMNTSHETVFSVFFFEADLFQKVRPLYLDLHFDRSVQL